MQKPFTSVKSLKSPLTEEQREAFLKDYLDLIGSMGEDNGLSRLWWATDISSKNRFESKLMLLLQGFLQTKEGRQLQYQSSRLKKSLQMLQIYLSRLRRVASLFFHAGRVYARSIYSRIHLSKKIRRQLTREKSYYVIRSFTCDRSFGSDGIYRDTFFGQALEFIKKKKDVLILTDILGDFLYCIKNIKKCSSHLIVPFEYFVSIVDIFRAIFRILTYKIRIDDDLSFGEYPVANIIRRELRRTLNGISIYQLLNYESVQALLRTISVDTFLLTYENNPWEKMCMLALRGFSPQTKIIGFQHNVVPQASTNLFISSKEKDIIPKPDRVLTTGEIPKKIMQRYGALNGEMIIPACALRHEYLFTFNTQKRVKSKIILLALEGIFDVYKMVNYCLQQLGNNNTYKIFIRSHPFFPVKRIQHKLIAPLENFQNVTVSEGKSQPLKVDIQKAEIVMYWGSTVGMEALWMGKPVIHYDNGSPISYDPLFDCPYLKWCVNEHSSLVSVLKDMDMLSDQEFEDQEQKAKNYLHQYFYSITEKNMENF